MNVISAQKWKGSARKTREGNGRVSPLRSVFFLGPIFHAIQSNNLVTVDHFKAYAFPVLKAIKYSCNINFTFSALKVAIVKLRAQFGNQHISLLASSLFMVRIRAAKRRRFAGWKWKFMRDRCKLALSFFPRPSYSTLSARDFSRAVSGFCQVFLAASAYHRRCVGLRPTPKIPAAREKKIWYQGYLYSRLLLRAGLAWSLATPPNNGELVSRLHGLELISSKWF